MAANIQLLIIDPQNDFCDLPEAWHGHNPATGARMGPSLPVQGAHADMLRLARFIAAAQPAIDGITVTLDSHHRVDVAHPPFWLQGNGTPVTPFTPITAQQVREGQYRPRRAPDLPRALQYLDALEARGRYTLMVWPVHCELGTWGHNVHAAVQTACAAWEVAHLRPVSHVHKGSNPWTEHYSAMQAEVPDEQDPGTLLNRALIVQLDEADAIVIAGEASSHCVRATTEDLAAHLPSGHVDKLVLLTDCMSPVAGFEVQAEAFLTGMRAQGARLMTADEAAQWLATANVGAHA